MEQTFIPSWQLRARAELERRQRRKASSKPRPELRGASLAVQTARDSEIALEGPAGTGKSFAILYKLHIAAQQYPGARLLIVRATRESLTESALVTFERDVLGDGNPIAQGAHRSNRHAYIYPNRSEIIVAGLRQSGKDMRAKVLSTEYDLIYPQEGSEILEDDYQKLTTRLRNNRMPYQQIVTDFNPDAPGHWLYRREASGKLKILYSQHQDNPTLWDGQNWTAAGAVYLERLKALTGIARLRFYEGKRAMAEGLVYGDVWSDGASDGNVTEEAEYQKDAGMLLWAVDDGYAGEIDQQTGYFTAQSHPRAILFCQLTPTGILKVFDESYAVKKLSDEHIAEARGRYGDPEFAAVDKSAAELIGRLNRAGIHTRRSPASVEESIKLLREWLAPDVNKVRKVLVHPRCRHLRYELASYKYEAGTEKPVKEFDHGADAGRYLVWTLRHN